MKSIIIMHLFLLCSSAVAMYGSESSPEDGSTDSMIISNRVSINGYGSLRNSTTIEIKTDISTAQELIQLCNLCTSWEGVVNGYNITPHAVAEYLWCVDAQHQSLDNNVLNKFKKLSEGHPDQFVGCVRGLIQQIFQQKNGDDPVRNIQKKFRQNKSNQEYLLNGKISQAAVDSDFYLKKNYIPYLVRSGALGIISTFLISGIGYFSYVLYHCSRE